MKQFKFLAPIAIGVSLTAVLFSCNSAEEKKAETPVDTTAAKPPEPAAPVKPANVMVVMAKVANFAKWLPDYESHDSVRLASGLHNYVIGRGVKDTNMVLVALKMDDVAKAKAFAASPDLKARMKKGGVMGAPAISYMDVQWMDAATNDNPNPTRLRVTHKVKDWNAWKTEFDSHKQARIDAGLIDRSVGYSMDDNHMVSLVFIVTDMKKAEDFAKSDDLKAKMEKAGVEGPPTMFFYTVAKKY